MIKKILVTGGTGSFGRAFVHRALFDNPERLVVFSRDEMKIEHMEREFRHDALRYFIGDVRDQTRLEQAMKGVDLVIHAAAMKIVPRCEKDPFECIKTNVVGAENVALAAQNTGAKRVIALSTDKACNPINLYGAAKLCAEKVFIAANNTSGGRTKYSVVRYGNVVGSRGSVIPLFKQCYADGRHIPITDPRMTRFWITLEQAVEFVISSVSMMQGGEIFVPKIPSMRITDLAEAVAPGRECDVVGIRPGEKIHETLLTEDEARLAEDIGDRYVVRTVESKQPCVGAFRSDTNSHWLTVKELRRLTDTDVPKDRRVPEDISHVPGLNGLTYGGQRPVICAQDPF